jgi:hypothetical protein
VVVGLLTLAFTASAMSVQKAAWADPTSIIGRLTAVDLAARRLTMVPDGAPQTIDLVLAPDAEVWQGHTRLSRRALAAHEGYRIKVRYRFDGDERRARSVTVEHSPER